MLGVENRPRAERAGRWEGGRPPPPRPASGQAPCTVTSYFLSPGGHCLSADTPYGLTLELQGRFPFSIPSSARGKGAGGMEKLRSDGGAVTAPRRC